MNCERTLTKWFNPNAPENEGLERLHLAVFKQKDAELSELRESLRSLREDNELLKSDKTKLRSENEAKSELVSALKTGSVANFKLQEKLQEDSSVLTQKLSAADQIIVELSETNRNLQKEIKTVKVQIDNMESCAQIHFLNDTILKLQEELDVEKNQSANLKSQIQNLAKELTEANDKNSRTKNIIC